MESSSRLVQLLAMGKGKKKSKGKKKGGKSTRGSIVEVGFVEPTQEQKKRAIEAALNRKEDPLKNWECPQQDECPICMMTLPPHESESLYLTCCGKTMCWGCAFSTIGVHVRNGRHLSEALTLGAICPFCRESHGQAYKSVMKRAEYGQHEAMFQVGMYGFKKGENSLKIDKTEGMKWLQRAVEAGSGKAAHRLGCWYVVGECVDRDIEKALGYFQKAAELNCIPPFNIMGLILMLKGEIEEAMLNFRQAAIGGISDAVLFGFLRYGFSEGFITKEEYALTLRKNQAICNDMNSEGRQKVRRFLEAREYRDFTLVLVKHM